MKKIINELRINKAFELQCVGKTPYTDFKGTQKDHDDCHRNNVIEYQRAINILKQANDDSHKRY